MVNLDHSLTASFHEVINVFMFKLCEVVVNVSHPLQYLVPTDIFVIKLAVYYFTPKKP